MVDFVLNIRSALGIQKKKIMSGGLRSLKALGLWGAWAPTALTVGSTPDPVRCFYIESPYPTGYRVSQVKVSESGSQTVEDTVVSSPEFTMNFDYKINHISKTKNHKNWKFGSAFVSERSAFLGIIFVDNFGQNIWKIL